MIYFLISNLHKRAFHFTVNKTLTFNNYNVLEKRNEKTNTKLLNKPKLSKKCQDKLVITGNKRYTKGVAYIVM